MNSREVETLRIDSVRLGELSFQELRAPVLGDGPAQDGGADAYGTLGFELFGDYLLTIDYPQNRLRIETGELPPADGERVVNYWIDLGAPNIDIDIGGRGLRASIDSGNAGGLMLPRSFAASLPLRGPLQFSGKVASSLGEFDLFRGELAGELTIGAFALAQPVVFFSDFVTVPNVGRGIIRTFAVTFDQKNRRVRFVRP